MTFTCPHLRPDDAWCLLLQTDCVCGRPGCVMRKTSIFLVPVEERIRLAAEARAARLMAPPGTPRSSPDS